VSAPPRWWNTCWAWQIKKSKDLKQARTPRHGRYKFFVSCPFVCRVPILVEPTLAFARRPIFAAALVVHAGVWFVSSLQ